MYLILLMTALASGTIAQTPADPAPPAQAPERTEAFAEEAKPACRDMRSLYAGAGAGTVQRDAPARSRRLDEMPAGNLELAVQREVDGCIEPTIIRQGYGAVAAPERR